MRRWPLLAVMPIVVTVLAGCSSHLVENKECSGNAACAATPLPTDKLIVLNRSIGGVSLFERRTAVERLIGHGKIVEKGNSNRRHTVYFGGRLQVWYVARPSRALIIRTISPIFHTASGIRVGSSFHKLHSIRDLTCYGGGQCQHGFHAMNQRGTGFTLDAPRGKVTSIVIATGH